MVVVAQLVRALDCGSRGRGFESPLPPNPLRLSQSDGLFYFRVVKNLFLLEPEIEKVIITAGNSAFGDCCFLSGIMSPDFSIRTNNYIKQVHHQPF